MRNLIPDEASTMSTTPVLVLVLMGLLVFGLAGPADAGTLYFNTSGSGNVWDNGVSPNWAANPGGPYNALWTSGMDGSFQGTPGTVTVSGIIPGVNAIGFAVGGYTLGGTGTLDFINSTAGMNIGVVPDATATINTAIGMPTDTAGGTGNKIYKTGSGKLILGGTVNLVADVNIGLYAGFTVDGGGELEIKGALKAASVLQVNRGNFTNTIGATSSGNTLRISGNSGATVLAGGMTVGGGTFGDNQVIISRPGTSSVPSYTMWGNSQQFNLGVSSSNNSFTVENGAYVNQGSAGGTNTWTIGRDSGANNNSLVVTGTGSTIFFGHSQPVEVGSAGSYNNMTIEAGGYFNTARIRIGAGGGSYNSFLLTGSTSSAYTNRASNSLFEIGGNAASSYNGMIIADGAVYNFSGTGTTRRFSIGSLGRNNYLEIKDSGSLLNVTFGLPIGIGVTASGTSLISDILNSAGNHLDIKNGGSLVTTTSIYVGGTAGALNIGDGLGISKATVGTTLNFSSGVYLLHVDSRLNMNSGQLTDTSDGILVSGAGSINLAGNGYFNIGYNSSIYAGITGSGSLTKEGIGFLTVGGIHSYTGDTTILDGRLSFDYAGLDDASAVNIGLGAVIGLYFSGEDTVGELFLNGKLMPPGLYNASTPTWGAYFAGSGTLNVATPEPATMSLLVLGGLAMLRRRRRA